MSDAVEEQKLTTHVAGVIEVIRTTQLTPMMRRVTFTGDALRGLDQHWRAEMLVRLYFPPPGTTEPPEPVVNENGDLEFRTPSEDVTVSPFSAFSEDPLVRAFTGRLYDAATNELDIDFVLHAAPGLAGNWAKVAKPGDRLGIVEFALPSGHDPAAARRADVFVMLADEAALPALQTNLELLPADTRVIAFVEVENADDEQPMDTAADLTITWLHRNGAAPGTSGLLPKAINELEWPEGDVFVWVCGEIKMVTEVRRFVKAKGLERGRYKTQAYWRRGKTEEERMARMTTVTMEAATSGVASFIESFEEIGMNVEDPTLFEDE